MIWRGVFAGYCWNVTVLPAKKLCGCSTGKEERLLKSLSELRSAVKRKCCVCGRPGLSYDQPKGWGFVQLYYSTGISAQLHKNIWSLTCYTSHLEIIYP